MSQSEANACVIEVGIGEGPVDFVTLDFPASCGGEAVFLGRTRADAHAEFGKLLRLEYEVYKPMAVKLLEGMARDAAGKWGVKVVRVVHASGAVPLGKASVVIQVASPHRREAFEACRYLIDRLKRELPVWKRETWERGETFVAGTPVEGAEDR
jgi:molybdopterin synthase catalytic subunit